MNTEAKKYMQYINTLSQIGIALSAEKDNTALLKKIVSSAMELTHADGGTLYLLTKTHQLSFEIFANRTLKIEPKRVIESDFPISSIPLYDANGQPNLKNIVSSCVLENKTQSIKDAYQENGFDFTGMKNTDKKLGYHSQSFLTIPLRNHENKIIGVLQLINAIDEKTKKIMPFSEESIQLAESLASQAAIALTQKELIQAQKDLFEALIQLIAQAIDEKSIYTSNHCTRVPILALMLADAVNKASSGVFKDFNLTKDQLEELRVASWLHDCGKITVPEYVVDKATKLETLYDRIEVIELRLEILKRDEKIKLLENKIDANKKIITAEYQAVENKWNESREFLRKVNLGGEFLSEADKEKINALAKNNYTVDGIAAPLLSPLDAANLSISKGTLNDKERNVIQNHVSVTQKMLQVLPYPAHLEHVPEIAGSHHERIDGKGYPRGLDKDALSVQTRMLTIADVFEALTAADRPYKKAKSLNEVINIMTSMAKTGHIDPDLFNLFLQENIHRDYAKRFLNPEQIDV